MKIRDNNDNDNDDDNENNKNTWNQSAIEPIQEIGRRIIAATRDTTYTRETVFLFQRLSIAFQRGNVVAFQTTFDGL